MGKCTTFERAGTGIDLAGGRPAEPPDPEMVPQLLRRDLLRIVPWRFRGRKYEAVPAQVVGQNGGRR